MKIKTRHSGFNYTGVASDIFLDSYWIFIPEMEPKVLDKLRYVVPPLDDLKGIRLKDINPIPSETQVEQGWNLVTVTWEGIYIEDKETIVAHLEGLINTLPEEPIPAINSTNIKI